MAMDRRERREGEREARCGEGESCVGRERRREREEKKREKKGKQKPMAKHTGLVFRSETLLSVKEKGGKESWHRCERWRRGAVTAESE